MAINHFTLQCRFVDDPVTKQTNNGKSVCNFRVAWSEKFGNVENKLFLRCTAWAKTGEFVQKHFKKGNPVIVEGSLRTNEYTDKDGNKKQLTDFTVEKCHFEPRNEREPQEEKSRQRYEDTPNNPKPDEMNGDPMGGIPDTDIPF